MKQDRKIHLNEYCIISSLHSESEFVGVRYDDEKKKFFITFPLGYNNSLIKKDFSEYTEDDEKLLRKEILNLINIIKEYYDTKQMTSGSEKSVQNDFPIYSYIYLINYFLKNGNFCEKTYTYGKGNRGKINWNKTLKTIKPIYTIDSAIYLSFIVKKNDFIDDSLFIDIYKFCVFEAFDNVGILLTGYKPVDPHIKFQKNLFLSTLYQKKQSTFNDQEKLLITHMENIIKFYSNEKSGENFFYGTNEFHFIWEKLVDNFFGINITEEMHPHISYKDSPRSLYTLNPDTIMYNKTSKKYYVLDGKYYKGALNPKTGKLPASDSVLKQIAYGDRLSKIFPENEIYNAFILPSDLSNESVKISYLCPVECDWLSQEDLKLTHKNIQAIKLDTWTLINSAFESKDETIQTLSKLIEDGFLINSD